MTDGVHGQQVVDKCAAAGKQGTGQVEGLGIKVLVAVGAQIDQASLDLGVLAEAGNRAAHNAQVRQGAGAGDHPGIGLGRRIGVVQQGPGRQLDGRGGVGSDQAQGSGLDRLGAQIDLVTLQAAGVCGGHIRHTPAACYQDRTQQCLGGTRTER